MTNCPTTLESAARILGISTEQLLRQIADQAFRAAAIEAAAMIFFAALLAALGRYVRKMNRISMDETGVFTGILLLLATIAFLVIVGLSLDDILLRLLNPNLWALKTFIKQ